MPRRHFAVPLIVSVVLGGCAGPAVMVSRLDAPPAIPAPAAARMPARAALALPEAMVSAIPESSFVALGNTVVTRRELGGAAAAMLRATLAANFAALTMAAPDAREPPAGSDWLFVPGVPTATAMFDDHAIVVNLRQRLAFPFELRDASGTVRSAWKVEGEVATGVFVNWLGPQRAYDAALLRNVAARLVVALHQEPLAQLLGEGPASGPQATAPAPARATPAPGLAVLRLDAGLPRDDAIEQRITDCVAGAEAVRPLVPAALVRDAAYPWLEPGVAPTEAGALAARLADPVVRARLAALGVGRLMAFTVKEEPPATRDQLACAAGYNAGACLGYWERRVGYTVHAGLWDVASGRATGSDEASVLRTLGVLGALLPIPFTHSNQAQACERLRRFVQSAVGASN